MSIVYVPGKQAVASSATATIASQPRRARAATNTGPPARLAFGMRSIPSDDVDRARLSQGPLGLGDTPLGLRDEHAQVPLADTGVVGHRAEVRQAGLEDDAEHR